MNKQAKSTDNVGDHRGRGRQTTKQRNRGKVRANALGGGRAEQQQQQRRGKSRTFAFRALIATRPGFNSTSLTTEMSSSASEDEVGKSPKSRNDVTKWKL